MFQMQSPEDSTMKHVNCLYISQRKKIISIENNTGDVETINGNKIRIGLLLKAVFVRRAKVSDNYDALIELKDKIPEKFMRLTLIHIPCQ